MVDYTLMIQNPSTICKLAANSLKKNSNINPGFANLNLSFSTGPVGQTYPSTYPPGYYGAGPQQQGYPTISGHCAPALNKSPITNNDHSAYYHHNSHHQPIAAPTVAPSAYRATQGSHPPSQPYGTLPTSVAPPNPQQAPPFQQPSPYAPHGAYHGQQQYLTSQALIYPQQLNLVSATPSSQGTPVYPIVSYPSAPGSSQYGTLRSSQSPTGPGAVSNLIGAPLHQYPPGNGTSHPASTAAVPSGHSMAPPGQPATVNGQGNADTVNSSALLRMSVQNTF